MATLDPNLDHIVYATPDLDETVEFFSTRYGIEATPGGRHEGAGSRNALIALGEACYLEIIGPDPDQDAPTGPRPFGMDKLTEPRLVTWAVKEPDLDARVARAREAGFDPGEVRDMSRARPDGELLQWRLTRAEEPQGDGLVPFLIDWKATPSPATTSAQGWQIIELRGEHPDPGGVSAMLDALGVELEVTHAERPALIAVIRAADTIIELR